MNRISTIISREWYIPVWLRIVIKRLYLKLAEIPDVARSLALGVIVHLSHTISSHFFRTSELLLILQVIESDEVKLATYRRSALSYHRSEGLQQFQRMPQPRISFIFRTFASRSFVKNVLPVAPIASKKNKARFRRRTESKMVLQANCWSLSNFDSFSLTYSSRASAS